MKKKFLTLFRFIKISPKYTKYAALGMISVFSFFTLLGIFQVLNIKTEYNFRQFFPSYHYLLRQDDQVKARFNLGEEAAPFLVVATINDPESDWSNQEYLAVIKKVTERMKALPDVKDVRNISTLQGAIQSEDGLGIGSILDHITPERFHPEIHKNPILSPLFITKDARTLSIFILPKGLQVQTFEQLKKQIMNIAQEEIKFADVKIGGVPAIQSDVNQILSREIIQFVIVAFFMCLIALALIFKNLVPIVLCTCLALVTNILSIWGISLFGFSFNIMSATIPILVTMTFISISVHSILRLIENLGKDRSKSQYHNQVLATFTELFRPNLLTALTLSAGFFTLIFSDSPIIKEYGLSVSIALMVTWANTSILLPACLLLVPKPILRNWMTSKARWTLIIIKFHKPIFFTILALSIFGAVRGKHLSWDARLFDDLPENHSVRKTTELVDQYLGGLIPLDIEVRFLRGENPWGKEDVLTQLNDIAAKIRELKGVGSVLTIADIMQASGLRTGKQKASPAEVMFLMSMSAENPLRQFLSTDSRSTRISIRLKDIPGYKMWYLVQDIRKLVKTQFPKARIKIAGTGAYIHDINNSLSKDLLYAFWHAMIAIFILLVITYKSIVWSVLACLPNLIPPTFLLGALSLLSIPIKPGIAIILSVSLGLGFTNTVFLLERMRAYLAKGHSYKKSLFHTFWSEANPCFISSMVLIVGFAAFAVSYFKMNQLFGVFMVFSVVAGLIGDLVLLPALLQLIMEKGKNWFKVPRIFKPLALALLTLPLLFTTQDAHAQKRTPAQSKSGQINVKTLAQNMQKMISTKDESGKIEMKIIEADKTSKTREISYKRLHQNNKHFTLMRMLTPKDVRGMALLSVITDGEEEKWIYLPSSKQTRKLSTTDSNARVLDSELNSEDFDLGVLKSSSSKILKTESDNIVVESAVSSPKSSYSKSISWVGRNHLLKKAELYDKKGALLKVINFPKYVEVTKGKWRPVQILIENVQNKRRTDLFFSQHKVNQNLKEKDFSQKSLAEDF